MEFNKYIKDYFLDELQELIIELGQKKFRAEQILNAIYIQRLSSFDDIHTIPKELRNKLSQNFIFNSIVDYKKQVSTDGTIKFLFKFIDGNYIETVLIPEIKNNKKRLTLCVSSQIGCTLNCTFCATGKLEYKRNLYPSEIIDQILMVEKLESIKINNIVFMGMGEPLYNFENVIKAIKIIYNPKNKIIGSKRITVSTVGVIDKIRELSILKPSVKLAVSLHATNDEIRNKLIPYSKIYKLNELLNVLDDYYRATKLPITYEYIVLSGLNDTISDIKRLAKISRRIPSKVNLIPYHDISFALSKKIDIELKTPTEKEINIFANELRKNGVNVFVRSSSGFDIDAACGQLAYSKRNV